MSHEVLIAGVGIVSPAGGTAQKSWRALLDGARCVTDLPELQAGLSEPVVGARAQLPSPALPSDLRDPMCRMALIAAAEAVGGDLGAFGELTRGRRLAICVGTSKGGIQQFSRLASRMHAWLARSSRQGAPERWGIELDEILDIPPDSAARAILTELGAKDACLHATVAACSTGTLSVIRGAQLIQQGEADVALCGGSDASLHALWLGAFQQMGALAPPHPTRGAAWACQPFDANRRGFVVGEGAGMVLLASAEAARVMNHSPIARVSGWATGTDPEGLTQLGESGETLEYVVRRACARASIEPASLSCIHAHGTGTLSNDAVEARVVARLLASRTTDVPIVSAKGAIGHLLGAAGAVEIGLAALAVQQGRTFGQVTLETPDALCASLLIPKEVCAIGAGPILKTAMGFGGHVAAIVLEKA